MSPPIAAAGFATDASPEVLLERGITLPPQPRVLQELAMLTQMGDPDVRDLASLIAQDPGLTAALYRAARSPLFAGRAQAQTVEQLVHLFGVPRTVALTHSQCLAHAMGGDAGVMERFWARSTAIAQLATVIVGDLPGQPELAVEQAYLAGIFHDCGVPVLMQRFPDYCRATGIDAVNRKWADVRTEDKVFQVDHAVVGYLLARHWRLPDFVAEAVRYHHELTPVPGDRAALLVAVLQLAMHLYANEMGLVDSENYLQDDVIAMHLGIETQELPDLSEWVLEKFRTLSH